MKVRLIGLLTVVLLLGTGSAFAHHGAAAYDMDKKVTIKGTVTDFQFVNPHVLIFMDVKDASGNVTKWQGELTSPNRLSRAGWSKSSIKVGDTITLSGAVSKTGSPTMWIGKVVGPSGDELPLGQGE